MVQIVEVPVSYVDPNSLSPQSPYASWDTAATNIQDAVAAGHVAGRTVWVTNGIYRTGDVLLLELPRS